LRNIILLLISYVDLMKEHTLSVSFQSVSSFLTGAAAALCL